MKIRGDVSIYHVIHKLKHGYQILCPVKTVSLSRFYISVAALLGAASLILTIKDGKKWEVHGLPWLSNRKGSSENQYLVAGLQNFGNNCFLNVILQALASCPSFHPFLQNILEENDNSLFEERVESMPLTVALAMLLKELCTLRNGRMVLSPRKVMLAMDLYIPSFNLMRQQDAAEAFLHLLSSLREELLECYTPINGSLAGICTLPLCRISGPKCREGQNEHERWQQHFFGPFNGILSSILTCKSCSFQLSMDFEFFHSLLLFPVLDNATTIMNGCTVENCLRQLTFPEKIEDYHCNRCWHIAAMNYLSSIGENEAQVEKLKCCIMQDLCNCKKIYHLERLPWLNTSSHAFKQISITRCPKILCMHIQRASMNEFGELIKLQGHISFPLILDLFPFTKDAVGLGLESMEENKRRMQANQLHKSRVPCLNHFILQLHTQTLQQKYGNVKESPFSGALAGEELGFSLYKPQSDTCTPSIEGESLCLSPKFTPTPSSLMSVTSNLEPSQNSLYHLVSVVEHFGKAGSGHYTIYRRMRAEWDIENVGERSEPASVQWFCISDAEVLRVSETNVLAAEASLLFYEKISESI